jgi:RNA recognition motif-containing protein
MPPLLLTRSQDNQSGGKEEASMTELYVGNLIDTVEIGEIRVLFSPYGAVHSVDLHIEFGRGKAYAYAFLEMDEAAAQAAIAALDGTPFLGQTLRVQKARAEQTPEP